jgi:hypothetical protein
VVWREGGRGEGKEGRDVRKKRLRSRERRGE